MRRDAPPPDPQASWAWFFDVDGTLVAIAARPSAVRIHQATHDVLRELCARAGGAVALLSGRAISDLDRLFPRFRFPAAGQHGAERRSASGRVREIVHPGRALVDTRIRLREAEAAHDGLILEDKGVSFALHYRLRPALAAYAHRVVRQEQRRLGRDYCVLRGNKLVELRPAGADKGRALRAFLEERPFKGRIPAFLGDDVTDEDAFRVVNRLGGYSIKVGPGRTSAKFRLADTAAVRDWLGRLSAAKHG